MRQAQIEIRSLLKPDATECLIPAQIHTDTHQLRSLILFYKQAEGRHKRLLNDSLAYIAEDRYRAIGGTMQSRSHI